MAREIRDLLTGGDRRSLGRVPKVLTILRRQPARIAELVTALDDPDPRVRMRAADALEKTSARHAEVLRPYKRLLLAMAGRATQQELRWHLAQLIPRLPLAPHECRRAANVFRAYLRDRSAIVRTFAMQALADLASVDATLRPAVVRRLRRVTATGTPAMRARGRRLLAVLGAASQRSGK